MCAVISSFNGLLLHHHQHYGYHHHECFCKCFVRNLLNKLAQMAIDGFFFWPNCIVIVYQVRWFRGWTPKLIRTIHIQSERWYQNYSVLLMKGWQNNHLRLNAFKLRIRNDKSTVIIWQINIMCWNIFHRDVYIHLYCVFFSYQQKTKIYAIRTFKNWIANGPEAKCSLLL